MPSLPSRLRATPRLSSSPRPNAHRRGYTRTWRVESKLFLDENPLCIDCLAEGKVVEATEVDHEIPHRGDQTLFWRRSNWRPRCKPHHSRKTARGE